MAARVTVGGRYRSLFVVGKGGMGSVEAALQADDAPRVVALKRLLPDAARDRRRIDMFLREAKLAAMLSHPNVVTAYDYGELDGELYLAMEYVEGQPLSRVLRSLAEAKQALPVSVVAYLLAEVCRGLHAAHELTDPTSGQPLNLVHRDVSPQNVMLGYDGRIRLLDFGVAKIETENVTKTGEVKGKTAYMSPEQAMGDPLDRRSDLFGVGALLFECLGLSRMWGDGTDMDVIRKLALEAPPGLERTGRTELPPELVSLHARLVARERDRRPSTAAEVSTALDAFVGDADAARKKLQTLLDEHFAEQAREQRAKLDSSLHEVVPSHADALRESLHPSTTPPPAAPARSPAPATAPAPAMSRPVPSRARIGIAGAGLAIAALVAWRAIAPAAVPPKPDPTPGVTSAALPNTPEPPKSVVAADVPPMGSAPAPSAPASAVPTERPARSASPSSSTSGPPRGIAAPPPTGPATVARPPASAPVRPPALPSAKPPDIDDHAF